MCVHVNIRVDTNTCRDTHTYYTAHTCMHTAHTPHDTCAHMNMHAAIHIPTRYYMLHACTDMHTAHCTRMPSHMHTYTVTHAAHVHTSTAHMYAHHTRVCIHAHMPHTGAHSTIHRCMHTYSHDTPHLHAHSIHAHHTRAHEYMKTCMACPSTGMCARTHTDMHVALSMRTLPHRLPLGRSDVCILSTHLNTRAQTRGRGRPCVRKPEPGPRFRRAQRDARPADFVFVKINPISEIVTQRYACR